MDELCHAVAIRIGSNDLDSDDVPAISTLVDCCQGLMTVDKGTSTVRLIHFTLQEHLFTHAELFHRAHSTMAETCLAYLNFQQVKDLPASRSPDPRDTPFLEYSSLYWGTHMRIELSDRAKALALQLLVQYDRHISAACLRKSINEEFPVDGHLGYKPFSALHWISYFGIAEVANTLIEMNIWDVNEADGAGVTPLIWAARYGHEEVVRLLLQKKEIQPDQQDANHNRTALSWAAGNGHEGVVSLFLEPRFVNPASTGRRRERGRREPDPLIGRRYVNPDSSGKSGRTPLSWAAGNGHEGVVKLLLGREDVNPDSTRESGRTPLSWAAENGREGVVKLLLGRRDVNPDTPDTTYGQSPLSWAAVNGHEGVVKLLLERRDVIPDSSDRGGRTPLSYAASGGHEGVVRQVLGHGDVNPNSLASNGRPLLKFCCSPHADSSTENYYYEDDILSNGY